MKRIAAVGSLLKKIYRIYSNDLLQALQDKGFIDLRPSFLEILTFVCEKDAPTIKAIGEACGLKKQTMTSHLNELEKRGYITRAVGQRDKRELQVKLTEYGQKFKITLIEVINDLELQYLNRIGDVELDRILHTLENLHEKVQKESIEYREIITSKKSEMQWYQLGKDSNCYLMSVNSGVTNIVSAVPSKKCSTGPDKEL